MVSLCIDKVTFLHIMTKKTLAKRILCYVTELYTKESKFFVHTLSYFPP